MQRFIEHSFILETNRESVLIVYTIVLFGFLTIRHYEYIIKGYLYHKYYFRRIKKINFERKRDLTYLEVLLFRTILTLRVLYKVNERARDYIIL
jgi:hypothetical protein